MLRYGDYFPYSEINHPAELPEWLNKVVTGINVHLILDQRLIQRSGLRRRAMHRSRHKMVGMIDTIEKYSKELFNGSKKKINGLVGGCTKVR